ncbi:hypothetical protein BD324DRAFT_604723 [Kockovaella imperatae]|uniref:VHS domain-domain-containing protein n=1 Tax=Kockovaella imperatae TaxID=4999 RepID=A0A1Y1U8Z7_9TREE|nr:hypothetical protein BD324DRAFT_604723 [Kockovaella imperatae]ORX34513.1 hypothetical protein BD324DRAFT_604723 [Kockovaella imperatae]
MLGPSRPWQSMSAVQALVEQACDPTLPAPNDAVNIELAELINRKKANSAREACHALLTHINSRNPNQALLALSVLEHLVRNCGYPVHLQISTKEFLNELVRRFPERPPMVTGRVMGRILELIHEWKNTLCVHSKYKDDLVHIRDMHRLLSYKGYRFKAFDAARAMASSNPNEDLKSPEELEEEDRAAKSAKLQELIRRGTPRDLAAAQDLMKALAGAEPDKAPDYASQTLGELEKVQSKAILLNDMLNNAKEGERIGVDGDVYDQVAAACRGARPKIQRWIEQDAGEREGMMERLLLCNDLINNALDRYEACKVGDWAKAQALVEASNPNKKAADLISFDAFADDEPMGGGVSLPADAGSSSAGMTSSGLPLDLFTAPSPTPSPGLAPERKVSGQRTNPMDFFNIPGPQGSMGWNSGRSAQVQQQPMQGYSLSPAPQSTAAYAPQQPQQQAPQQAPQPAPQPPQPKKDAFADLVNLMD